MSANENSLLLRIRGDASGGKQAVAETRQAVAQLRASTTVDFKAIQTVSTQSLASITQSLANVPQGVPVLTNAVSGIATAFNAVSSVSRPALDSLTRQIDGIAKASGKTSAEVRTFLTGFARLEGQAARNEAAFKAFGGSVDLIGNKTANLLPELEKAAFTSDKLRTGLTGAAAGASSAVVPIVLAVAALGTLASAATGAVQGLFDLTRQTAQFQGKLFDLSQQTGVSVETLSALEVVARTTGSSIEQITASLGIFQKNLEESLDANSKAAEAFKRLGVEVTNTEQTFRDTLQALARMPEGFRQTALALELFGRGGKSVLAILKETNGDIDGTIAKLQGLGLVTTEQALAADKFNDQLVLLQVALRGLGAEAIPPVTEALVQLQKTIDENKGAIDFLKTAIGFLAGSFALQLETAVKTGEAAWRSHKVEVDLVTEAYQILRNAIKGTVAEIPKVALPTPGAESGIDLLKFLKQFGVPLIEKEDFSKIPGLFKPDARKLAAETEKALAEAEARAARSIQLAQERLEESTRAHRVTLERERELDLRSIDEWETEAERLVNDHLTTQNGILDQELANYRKFISDRADLLLAEQGIQQRRTELINRTAEELQRIDDEAQRRRDQTALAVEQQLISIREAERDGELQRIEAALDRRAIIESEAATRRLALEREAQADRVVLINTELELLTTSVDRKVELDNLKIESEQRFTDLTRRLIQERNEARERETANQAPGAQGIPEQRGPLDILPGEEAPDQPIRDLNDALLTLGETLAGVTGASDEFGKQFGQVLGSTISDLAFSIGDLVHQWVLLGDTGPNAMRKLTASVLAGLAAQAAVKAIFQLAEGFAALFFNPAEAAAHFTSAALFGSIAAAAGAAGRAVAGDLFKQSARGGGAPGGPSQQLNPLNLARNSGTGGQPQQAPQIHPIRVEINVNDSKFGKAITAHVVDDVNNAGPIREVIAGDGNLDRG